jgi:hypothetical protein
LVLGEVSGGVVPPAGGLAMAGAWTEDRDDLLGVFSGG